MQKSKMSKIYDENKAMVWAGIVGIVLILGILFKVKDEVTRFTLIMPVFAGFILFSILTATDEQLGDTPEESEKEKKTELKKKK
jgi:phosphoglycerol transferase MdoB-like AlkP superfamily enzyme